MPIANHQQACSVEFLKTILQDLRWEKKRYNRKNHNCWHFAFDVESSFHKKVRERQNIRLPVLRLGPEIPNEGYYFSGLG